VDGKENGNKILRRRPFIEKIRPFPFIRILRYDKIVNFMLE
jgi:hypothetical protein